jgi:hypothetical protein
MQVCGAVHTVVQLPQCIASVVVLTHISLQFVSDPQSSTHAPRAHLSPASQTTPQPPQLFLSSVTDTHRSPHRNWPTPQPHVPAMHCSVSVQACPHSPQFFGSRANSTQLVPQRSIPASQRHNPS